jgi:hypothetical protein
VIDRTYNELEKFVRALAGVHKFTEQEQGYIESFANVRARMIYDASNFWPRYLSIGSLQPVLHDETAHYILLPSGWSPIMVSKNNPLSDRETQPIDFNRQQDQLLLSGRNSEQLPAHVFLTAKTQLEHLAKAQNSAVPDEFYQFIGHGAYSDFLRMDGQTDKALAESQFADRFLIEQLQHPDLVRNQTRLSMQIRTNYSTAPSYF